ncbi:MAG: (2Fe-2S)-binding protein [Deltaproteobacteria bacterium]|nr:(2Fe-2S)-binding protein [Deltaproteobacteria bacterium]
MEITLRVNGENHGVDVDPQKPLLWVLREEIGLTGTKYGCGIGLCGACTVLLDGSARASCTLAVGDVGLREITTIEGLDSREGKALKEAWISEKVSQCGYCQPGQLLKATELLVANPQPADGDISTVMTGLCRCGTYQRMRSAIKTASVNLSQTKESRS